MRKIIILFLLTLSLIGDDFGLNIKLIPAESVMESNTSKNLYNEINYYSVRFNGIETNSTSIPTLVALPGDHNIQIVGYRIRNSVIDNYNVPQAVFRSEAQSFSTSVGSYTVIVTMYSIPELRVIATLTGYVPADGIYQMEYEKGNIAEVIISGGVIDFNKVTIDNPPLKLIKDTVIIAILNYDRYRFPEYRYRDLELIPVQQTINTVITTNIDQGIYDPGVIVTSADSSFSVGNIPLGDYKLVVSVDDGLTSLNVGQIIVTQPSGSVTVTAGQIIPIQGDTILTFLWDGGTPNDLTDDLPSNFILKLELQAGI